MIYARTVVSVSKGNRQGAQRMEHLVSDENVIQSVEMQIQSIIGAKRFY